MGIRAYSKTTVVEYVPAYGDNRDDPDPCVVSLTFCPHALVMDYSARIRNEARSLSSAGSGSATTDKTEAFFIATEKIERAMFLECVKGVSGFFIIDEEGQEREVTEVETFLDSAPEELVKEVRRAIESLALLSDGDKKKFKGR